MSTKQSPACYRLKITHPAIPGGNPVVTYFVRYVSGSTSYMSSGEIPLALSNLVYSDAAGVRFELEDTTWSARAKAILQEALDRQWANNKHQCPKVTEL